MTREHKYILNGRVPEACADLLKWARSMQETRIVAQTAVTDEVMVSTIFLGIDHSYTEGGPPILFETMVFGPEAEASYTFKGERRHYLHRVALDDFSRRHCTYDDAEKYHAETVTAVKQKLDLLAAEVREIARKLKSQKDASR